MFASKIGLSMGGRDCSLQMHEQKLLEISMTSDGLTAAIQSLVLEDRHLSSPTRRLPR